MRKYLADAKLRIKFESTNGKLLSFFVLLVFIDQLSKYLIRHGGGFYVCNHGIAFSLLLSPIIFWFFWLAIVAFIIAQISNFEFRISKQFSISNFSIPKPALYLILAGALSNIFDRLYLGCVIDFIHLGSWTVFNLADAFITIGVIITLIEISNPKSQISKKLP